MSHQRMDAGFTTVELLVTLIVVALFLGSGYLLYQTLTLRSGEARWELKASELAYDYVNQYAEQGEYPCTAKNPTPPEIEAGKLPGDVAVTVAITCPQGTSSPINRTTVTITYGQTQEESVTHARDVSKRPE